MKITIFWANEQKALDAGRKIKCLIRRAIKGTLECEGFTQDACVSVTFTDNDGICRINRDYRAINAPTDVLSFPMYDMKNGDIPAQDGTACELGDIVLSLERAAEQAEEFGHSYERECAFLTVHSVLHLLGYDHVNSEAEENEMRKHQRTVMKHIGIER